MAKSYNVKIDPTQPAVLSFTLGGQTHDYWEHEYTPAGGKKTVDNGPGQAIPSLTLPATGLDGGKFTLKVKILPANNASYPWKIGIDVKQQDKSVASSPFEDGNPNATGPAMGWIDLTFGS